MGLARLISLFFAVSVLALAAACGPARRPAPTAPPSPQAKEASGAVSREKAEAESVAKPKAAPKRAAIPLPESGGLLTSGGTPLTLDEFARLAAGADYVLIGEGHTSVCDHLSQARLIAAMAEAGNPPTIGLEMVPVDRADALWRFNRGELWADDLEEALGWDATWGYPFDLYAPIFKVAEKYKLSLEALNAPQAVIDKVSAQGLDALDPEERAMIPDTVIPPPLAQAEALRESFQMHDPMMDQSEKMGEERLERFFLIQSIWDTKMAQEAVRAHRELGRPVAVIAGAGHVEYGWGIRHRLDLLHPGSKTLLVMPWRGPGDEAMEGEPKAGDLFYYCPPSHRSSMGMTLELRGDQVVVTHVAQDSRAMRAGLAEGDVIVRAGGLPVDSLMVLHTAGYTAHKEGKNLILTVRRGDVEQDIDMGPLGQGQ